LPLCNLQVKPKTLAFVEAYWGCLCCGKVYWEGEQFQAACEKFGARPGAAGPGAEEAGAEVGGADAAPAPPAPGGVAAAAAGAVAAAATAAYQPDLRRTMGARQHNESNAPAGLASTQGHPPTQAMAMHGNDTQ
jgi:hypothetical protein